MRYAPLCVIACALLVQSSAAAHEGDGKVSQKSEDPTPAPTAAEEPADLPTLPPSSAPSVAPPSPPVEALPPPPHAPIAAPEPPIMMVEQEALPPEQGPTKMASPGLFIAGLALGGPGFVTFFSGLGLRYSDSSTCNECPLTSRQGVGVALMLGGAVAFAVGAGFVAYGARQVPDRPSWAGASARPSRAVPEIAIGPSAVRLRWQF